MSVLQARSCTEINYQHKDVYRITKELQDENKFLKTELEEIKVQLNYCLSKIHHIEDDSKRSELAQVIAFKDSTNAKAIDAIKLQLCTACQNIFELKEESKQLEKDMVSLNCKCAEIERDLEINGRFPFRKPPRRQTGLETEELGFDTATKCYRIEVDTLKRQLLAAWNNISELSFENRQLETELASICCKCRRLGKDLIHQQGNKDENVVDNIKSNDGICIGDKNIALLKNKRAKLRSSLMTDQKEVESNECECRGCQGVQVSSICKCRLERIFPKSTKDEQELVSIRRNGNDANSHISKIDSLKRGINTACDNVIQMNLISRKLEEELIRLNSKCARLDEDISQQAREELDRHTNESIDLDSFKGRTQDSPTSGNINQQLRKGFKYTNCKCTGLEPEPKKQNSEDVMDRLPVTENGSKSNEFNGLGVFRCNSDLDVIARKLSKTLEESKPCEVCAKMPRELASTTKLIKDLTDLVQHRKKDDVADNHDSLTKTNDENVSFECR